MRITLTRDMAAGLAIGLPGLAQHLFGWAWAFFLMFSMLVILVSRGTIAVASSTKAQAVEARLNAHIVQTATITQNHATKIATLNTQLSPIVNTSGKAAYLATISQVAAPTKAGAPGTPSNGVPAPSSYSSSYVTAMSNNFNGLLNYVGLLAGDVNGIYDQLQNANIFT
jgi:hypothetical protein